MLAIRGKFGVHIARTDIHHPRHGPQRTLQIGIEITGVNLFIDCERVWLDRCCKAVGGSQQGRCGSGRKAPRQIARCSLSRAFEERKVGIGIIALEHGWHRAIAAQEAAQIERAEQRWQRGFVVAAIKAQGVAVGCDRLAAFLAVGVDQAEADRIERAAVRFPFGVELVLHHALGFIIAGPQGNVGPAKRRIGQAAGVIDSRGEAIAGRLLECVGAGDANNREVVLAASIVGGA